MTDTLLTLALPRTLLPLGLVISLLGCGGRESGGAASDTLATGAPIEVAAEADSLPSRVTLTAAAVAAAGIRTESAKRAERNGMATMAEVPGQVEADPSRTAYISARGAGRLERLTAVMGDRVSEGQVVAFVMSPEFLTAQTDFRQATRRAVSLAGSTDSGGGQALAAAARARLRLFGVGDSELDRLAQGGEPSGLLPVTAPFQGSLVEGLTLAGASVAAGTPIFRLIDLRQVDIAASVPERFLPGLRIGQRATVTVPAYPGRLLSGHVERIKDELDPSTRTVEALIHVENPGRVLRPGMFAQIRLHTAIPSADDRAGEVSVPATALMSDGEQRYVFVEVAPRTYERRAVELGMTDVGVGGAAAVAVELNTGVRTGERVVVQGAFTLKSELAKAGFAEEE